MIVLYIFILYFSCLFHSCSTGSSMDITFFYRSDGSHPTEKLSETERQTVAKVLALLEAAYNMRVLVRKSGQIVRQTSQSSVYPSACLTKHIRTVLSAHIEEQETPLLTCLLCRKQEF